MVDDGGLVACDGAAVGLTQQIVLGMLDGRKRRRREGGLQEDSSIPTAAGRRRMPATTLSLREAIETEIVSRNVLGKLDGWNTIEIADFGAH